ncbi:MAG: tRNA (N(6)-L-threonylcarbamoyladenosine(37)-C(2))-methylthiotransferase MtaB [Ruminococcaceae bacterium]|nr:tRNA (N(6)-L-threonylcarbamoyladenosine(37)-C(2))-methylthiotransferase MtaB [Oscillospiraceae bacterium]
MQEKKYTVGIATLGCKVNQYESQAIAEELERRGFEIISPNEVCDAYIINTCTVTAESDRKARQTIRRAISKSPDAYVLVTGCYSQLSPHAIKAIKGVDYVCGSANKMTVADELCKLIERGKRQEASVCVCPLDRAAFEPMSIKKFDRTRAYVKIQDGCESKCTYCAIPYSRGPIRSKPFDDVLNEVRDLIDGGCYEIVLTGIETGCYGTDLPEGQDLASLLCAVDKLEGIGRVRLGSLDPTVIKPDFVNKIKNLKSLAPHFHLSLQSGSDRILALMKRKYNSRQAMRAIELLRGAIPSVQFTTDIIAGFPEESEQDFLASCEFVKNAKFLMVHAFPYSKRQGTPAAEMVGQLQEGVKHDRVRELNRISADVREVLLYEMTKNETVTEVLFESYENGYAFGHTANFVEVRVKVDHSMHGQLRLVKLIGHTQGVCEGIIV